MIGTFLYYLALTLKNRVVSARKRLRQPKYLISALAGLGYMYLVFFRQFFSRPRARVGVPEALGLNISPLVETGLAVVLFVIVLLPWIWPGRSGAAALRFTEAEIQFLFPAPISRQSLIRFRLVRMQIGIMFAVFISFLFGRGSYFEHPAYFLVALWTVYSFLALYYTGTALAKTSLAEHGASGFKRQVWVLGILAATAIAIVVWMKWYIPPLPDSATAELSDFSTWLMRATDSGPAHYLLLPFKAFVRTAFAPDFPAFLLRLAPVLAILCLTYLWVMHSDASFEEASLDLAKKIASRIQAARSGSLRSSRRTTPKTRRPLFKLAPAGFAHTAIFWKNCISAGRLNKLRVLLVILSLGVAFGVSILGREPHGEMVSTIIGSIAAMIAGFLTLLGPMMIRDDLRSDLLQLDLLKTYPIAGWSVVLGEVLAPASILAVAEWFLLFVAACLLPSVGKFHPSVFQRCLVGVSAGLLLPCFSLNGVLIQNAAVLIWPGWVELGKGRRHGIEAMGQRMITMVAAVLVLVFSVIPAAVLFAAIFFLGFWLLGLAVLPIAALVAAAGLLVESAFAILWLSRIYDKFDLSLEGGGRTQ